MKLITTSWDDGHALDFKLAELLTKYNLQGTFYIPKFNVEHAVMPADKIIMLAKKFEIGGHSLHHVRLDVKDKYFLEEEIIGSFKWLKELLGNDPVSFCFPKGRYNNTIITAVFKSGYKLARTAELLSIEGRDSNGLVPTTLQVYSHNSFTYIKHLIKRQRWMNLIKWLNTYSLKDLLKLAEAYINEIMKHNGCFHLWGHSWEIEEYSLWKKLEGIFKIISNITGFTYIQNKGILHYSV